MRRRTFALLALAGRSRLGSLGLGGSLAGSLAMRSSVVFGLAAATELVPDDSELIPRVL